MKSENPFKRYCQLFALALLCGLTGVARATWAGDSTLIKPGVIIPGPVLEIQGFQTEWCGPANADKLSGVAYVCFGASEFQAAKSVRSAVLVLADGSRELYVESQWPGVELLKPKFEIIGPINRPGKLAETGMASVHTDARGEVDAIRIWTPRRGMMTAIPGTESR